MKFRPESAVVRAFRLAVLVLAVTSVAAGCAQAQRQRVAIVLYPGVELLDFAGPGEVFSAAGFRVFTVAVSDQPLVSQGFVRITPQFAMADSPQPDIVVIPGGDVSSLLDSPQAMAWLDKAAKEGQHVLSVCNGALVLAKLGLLDGLEATTHHGSFRSLRSMAPNTIVHEDRRFVDNGKIITSAGVSAGIDGSLHLVSRLLGEGAAKRTARYMEYDWRPEDFAAPAAAE